MPDITLEQVIKVCGNYTSKNGANYSFRCPICEREGHDKHGDNLNYNESRKIIKCFANSNHTLEVLSMINNTKDEFGLNYKPLKENEFSIPQLQKPIWEIRQEQYVEYMYMAQDILLNNKELLLYLYQKRGWKKLIIDLCGIGFDDTENCFTIPIFSLKHSMITDFELREKAEQKKIRRVGGGCSTIAQIWGMPKAKELFIVEGFVDGITLAQWLLETKKHDSFTIYSCSNGVGSLFGCLSEINFKNFESIKMILDNDDAGNEASTKIREKYPFIKDSRQFLVDSNCKDINEYYMKKVRSYDS